MDTGTVVLILGLALAALLDDRLSERRDALRLARVRARRGLR